MSCDGRHITYDAVLYALGAVLGDLSKSQPGRCWPKSCIRSSAGDSRSICSPKV